MQFIQIGRPNIRFDARQHRRSLRDVDFDDQRGYLASNKYVAGVANRLKARGPVEANDLKSLRNALFRPSRIQTFMEVDGAMHGLVGELSGKDVANQIEAAGCLCNLALGDDSTCLQITNTAGSYLITGLDSPIYELVLNCIWAIGNLGGAACGATEILVPAGAADKLIALLAHRDPGIVEAALEALTHFMASTKAMQPQYISRVLEKLETMELNEATLRLLNFTTAQVCFTMSLIKDQHYVQKLITLFFDLFKDGRHDDTEMLNLINVFAQFRDQDVHLFLLDQLYEKNYVNTVAHLVNRHMDDDWSWFLSSMIFRNYQHRFFVEFMQTLVKYDLVPLPKD